MKTSPADESLTMFTPAPDEKVTDRQAPQIQGLADASDGSSPAPCLRGSLLPYSSPASCAPGGACQVNQLLAMWARRRPRSRCSCGIRP
jgi:hypothetical protein